MNVEEADLGFKRDGRFQDKANGTSDGDVEADSSRAEADAATVDAHPAAFPGLGPQEPCVPSQERSASPHLVLVDANALRRHAYAALFATALPGIAIGCRGAASEILEPDPDGGDSVRVVLLSVGEASLKSQDVANEIASTRRLLPNVPLAILSDRDGGEEIACALASEIRGYIPTSHPPSLAAAAINLVLAGGIYVPPTVIAQAQAGRAAGGTGPDPSRPPPPNGTPRTRHGMPLSQRQAEVLRLLQQGKPNKIIAHELDMRESTVKVHVHEMMRKLNASNRTELAYLAFQVLPSTQAST